MKAESDRINSPRSPLSKSGRRPHASVGEPEGLDGYLMASLSRLGSSDRTETSSQPATRHEKPANRELLHSSAPRMMAVQDTHPMPPSAPQMTAVQYQNLSLSSGRRGRSDHDSMTATCAACDALIQVIEAADPGSPLSQISLDIPPSFHEETSVRLQGPEASSKPAVSIPGAYVESHSCSVPVAFSYAGSSDFSMRVPATVRSMRRNPSSDSLLSDASVLQQQRAQAHRGGDPALGHSAVSEAHISCERGREQSRATGMCGAESDASAAKADGLSPPATPPTGDQASTSSRPSSANEDAKELSVVQTIKLAHLKSMLADMEAAYCALSCTRQKGQLSEEIIRIKRELKLTATSHY